MTQRYRVADGLVDRDRTLGFTFNDDRLEGHPGDTLASALLANGRRLVARSFKYHRPRGILSAGSEEPNALVTLGRGADREPNRPATAVELVDGMTASSQNHVGSLERDFMAFNDALAPFIGAGFYYKTFMWPQGFWERLYEPAIRSVAGLGRLSTEPDPSSYDKGFLHCDVLVIGAGPAGLAAATTASRAGARVIVADEDFLMGGRLNAETFEVADAPGSAWAADRVAELQAASNARLLPHTTVFGVYDQGVRAAVENRTDATGTGLPRQILWRISAKRTVLCAGATERPIAFGNNDRPGVMLAGAVRAYVNRWGVAPGNDVAIFTNNDDGWRAAHDLAAKGVRISTIIDPREDRNLEAPPGVSTTRGGSVVNTRGRHGLRSITCSDGRTFPVDCLAVSGGWNPNVHLACHKGERPVWRDDVAAFVPGDTGADMRVAGAANGTFSLAAALREGHVAGRDAASDLGLDSGVGEAPRAEDEPREVTPYWHVAESRHRAWIDFQNDVTTKDIALAHREGYVSVEHLKRYTTLGMGTDQGRTGNVVGLAVLAELSGKSIPKTGTTAYRAPYTPTSIGVFAGRARGPQFRPRRLTPSHRWAEEQGAVFVETGMWLRAQWFPREGESHWRESVDREVRQTRASVGVCDVTTLGKIDIQGKDAAAFLNKIYANGFAKLAVGKVRYGLMLREDGIVMDDGTTARLAENHFLMTTTTANAVSVFRHLEFCRQCLWPSLDVHLISATEQYAQFAVAGPKSRQLLRKVVDPQFDISNDAFQFMACASLTVCGCTPARLFRISFSGELAYEIAVPARYGDAMIRRLMEVGHEFGVVAYGTEALGVMRIEKGHAAGAELDGRTTARGLGMGRMVSKKKDCIGNTLSERSGLNREDGPAMVGFLPTDRAAKLAAGSHLFDRGAAIENENDRGWLSSVAFSPTLGHMVALGFIERGQERKGDVVRAVNLLAGQDVEVEIVSPHFVDPDGERMRV